MKKHVLIACMVAAGIGHSYAQNAAKGNIEAFTSRTGSIATIDRATNSLSFLRFPAGKAFLSSGGDIQQKTGTFLEQNAGLFAMRAGEDAHRFKEQRQDQFGLQSVTMQQTYRGVPVYDGLVRFHYNRKQSLTSLNGNFISDIKVNPVPTLAQHEAEEIALKYLQKGQLAPKSPAVRARKSTLYIFQKGLVQGYNGTKHLVYEVELNNEVDVREFLYIDAHSGALVEQFTGNHSAIDRRLYQTSLSPTNLKWKEGDAFPGTLDRWQQSEVASAGFIYNLMKNTFGRVSYDGEDAAMITINDNPAINCPNANWNGVTANYCTNVAADDVVAHEWGHAYTEYTSGLVYAWQPGALNEAYSDIWGETVDMLNGYMDEGESNAARTGCGTSARWQVGEKAIAFGGAIRDMWNPNCFGNPGRVNDPMYHCFSTDVGGVHINSGVINHAYALLVDGGTYNGQTIAGIGITKAAHIFWHAQANYMTATTDFAAQADILTAAGEELLGLDLPELNTGSTNTAISGQQINNTDLQQLAKVIAATEMRTEPTNCGFQPFFEPVAALCEGAKKDNAIFFEDFENGFGDFTTSHTSPSGIFTSRDWIIKDAPEGGTGKAAFAVDYSGSCGSTLEMGVLRLESPGIEIPEGTSGDLSLAFDHYVATEAFWDGGNIKYSINDGDWTLLPARAFTANGYNNVLNSVQANSNNPLAGQPAFSGTDEGKVSGSWGQSQVNLSEIGLQPGDQIRLRWEFGTDECNGLDGWFVDNISLYTCASTPAVHFAVSSTSVNEAAANQEGANCMLYAIKNIAVKIDKAPTQPVVVTFNTPGGTAKPGGKFDYTISPATVTLAAGELSKNVTVRVNNDAYIEGDETVVLSYTINNNGGDGYVADSLQTCVLTIVDDDAEPGNYTENLLSSAFNTSQGEWSIINGGNSGDSWFVGNFGDQAYLDADGKPFFMIWPDDSPLKTALKMDEIIESPEVNTLGKKNMELTFDQDWNPYRDTFSEQGTVEVWDGKTWHTLLTQTQDTPRRGNILNHQPDVQILAIPDAYANAKMKIRFRYVSQWDTWWAVDNINLTASNSTDIQTAVNATAKAETYLGPNETAAFYDPASGNLMMKIKNLSAHDYGCTTVEVDRAGQDETDWVGSYHITKKTFKVTPTNNNANGKYEITLYYKASELPNFNGSDITSMGKSEGSISSNNTLKTSFAMVQVRTAFDADFAFTSTFDSGFSGFGLSDAPPVGPLPVTLVQFEGTHTPEGNQLTWSTTSETNNAYFAVERTLNGRDFEEIGQVAGAGSAILKKNYRFTDGAAPAGISYYRLKQVDADGKFFHSRIISIDAAAGGEMRFFPNPVQSVLTMELPDEATGNADVAVFNAAGQQVILRKKVRASQGRLSIDLGKLPAGNYQIKVTGDKSSYSRTVFKY